MRQYDDGVINSARLANRLPATVGRQVGHGRGVYPNPDGTALSLECRGSVWCCPRHSCSGSARGHAAKCFFRRLLKGLQYAPRAIVTDKLRSYDAARRHLAPQCRAPAKPITIALRTHTDRPVAENNSCSASSLQSKPRRFSPSRIHTWSLPSTPTPIGSHRLPRDPV